MKQLEINNLYAKLETEHGITIKISEGLDGNLKIVLHAPVGQSIRILPNFGNVVYILRI